MATKKELLKNLRIYTPEEIAEAVKAGNITLYELAKESEGAFTPLLKKQVKEILERKMQEDSNNPAQEVASQPPAEVNELPSEDVIQADVQPIIIDAPVESITNSENGTLLTSVESAEHDNIVDNRRMFKRPFDFFNGRIRRLEFWLSLIIAYVISFFIGFLVGATNGSQVALYVLLIPVYWFILAQGSKRCHDRGNSGWYQLIPFYSLWMAFADSEEGVNEYGNNPKS